MLNTRSVYSSEKLVRTTSERLSSGMRINRGADDPSGLGISSTMKSQYRGISTALENMQDIMCYLEARDKSMNEQMNIALRIRDLAVRAANDATLTSSDLAKLNNEASALAATVETIGRTSTLRGTEGSTNTCATLFGPGELDIVWVLDQTGSMGAHLTALRDSGADQMFNSLTAKKFDLRMAAVGFGVGNNVTRDLDPVNTPRNGSTDVQFMNNPAYVALSNDGGRVFRDNAGDFKSDITAIVPSSGSQERGIDAIFETTQLFGLAPSDTASNIEFRQDAQKVIMLITDEYSMDNNSAGSNAARGVPDYLKNELAAAMTAKYGAGAVQIWSVINSVGNFGGAAQDVDYTDIDSKTYALDLVYGGTNWINTVVADMQGLGGPYKLYVQYGPDAGDTEQIQFKTVTAATTGLANVNLSTAGNAQASITTAQNGIDFIANEQAATGTLQERFSNMINDYTKQMINLRGAYSTIAEADMADHASQMAKQQIILDASMSISTQARDLPRSAIDLIAQQGVGQKNELLHTGL